MVLILDEDSPRGFLEVTKGTEVGRDGEIRGATLKVGSKDGTPTVLQRPLQLIYPLEINSGPPIVPILKMKKKPVMV